MKLHKVIFFCSEQNLPFAQATPLNYFPYCLAVNVNIYIDFLISNSLYFHMLVDSSVLVHSSQTSFLLSVHTFKLFTSLSSLGLQKVFVFIITNKIICSIPGLHKLTQKMISHHLLICCKAEKPFLIIFIFTLKLCI